MKIFVGFFGFVVAVLLGGCAPPAYYGYGEQYPIVSAPPVQYAPQQVAPVGCIPPYVPSWNGCALPMYRPQYYIAPMYDGYYGYGDSLLSFKFIFGGGGKKHHGGGRHYRGRR